MGQDFETQLRRPGFARAMAHAEGRPVGFAYGYTMTSDMPRWHSLIEPHRDRLPPAVPHEGRVLTLMEFAVLLPWRGQGIGRALHDRILGARTETFAMLTVRPDAVAAQTAYRSWGWRKVGHRPRESGPGYDILIRPLP